jgi:hypothetical protein
MLMAWLSPLLVLGILLAISLIAYAGSVIWRQRRRGQLARLAREWHMQYSPGDVFQLAGRVAPGLPVIGAADVRVHDVIYGSEPGGYRCIFSAEYTAGVVRSRSRRRCVVSILEPRTSGSDEGAHPWSMFKIALPDLPLLEQYRSLYGVGEKKEAE